jgi:hypothetical protein
MIFTDHFSSAKSTLANAKYHIGNLRAQIESFMQDKPWSQIIEDDFELGKQIHKVRFGKVLAENLPNIVFDAANNLRSVLDQAGYAAAAASGVNKPKNSFFPVADDEAGLRHVIGRKRCKDLPPEILALFCGFKPYKGGNDAIWALNRLVNTKKHALLVPVGLAGFGITGGHLHVGNVVDGLEIGFWWDPLNNEVTYIRAGLKTEIDYNTNFTVAIAFDDAQEVIGGQHPVAVMETMAREVERVLMATEAECRRLGFVR